MAETAAPDPLGSIDAALTDAMPPDATPAAGFPIVAIGASAGGLAALSALLEGIPPDSGMAFVVVTHLEPQRESHMPRLLARHTSMPVNHAQEGQPVKPNHVYVIPPNALLSIAQGTLHLQALPERSTHPKPIDAFMRDLAHDQNTTSVAIVLSGIDADGSVGVKQIKAHGGMVMAQEPQSAEYPEMPRNAVATGLADFVLPVEQMGPALVDYARAASLRGGSSVQSPGDVEDLTGILMALFKGGGPDFRDYKPGMIERRIRHRMAMMGLSNLAEFRRQVESSAETRQLLVDDLLIGVTEFFREPKAWAELAERVLPELLSRTDELPVRVWVPGCASGEEAYTLAMLLSEQAPSADTRARIEIFATDIDRRALEIARAGVYPASVTHAVSPERLRRFFVQVGDSFQVKKELRALIVFSAHDLLVDPPFYRMDIVSCRNLLIYLQPAAQRTLSSSFAFSLREDGYLFLGRSENLVDEQGLFQEISSKSRIFKRNAGVRPRAVDFNLVGRPGAGDDQHRDAPLRRSDMTQLVQRALLAHFAPAGVLIGPAWQMLYYHGDVEPFLRRAPGAPSNNLLEAVRDGLSFGLRSAWQQAVDKGHRATVDADMLRDSHRIRVRIDVMPVKAPLLAGAVCLVTFRPSPPPGGAGGRGRWRRLGNRTSAAAGARGGAGRASPPAADQRGAEDRQRGGLGDQ